MKVLILFLCFLYVSCKISYDEWVDPGASISTLDSTFEEQNCHVDNDCSLIPGRYTFIAFFKDSLLIILLFFFFLDLFVFKILVENVIQK